MPQQSDEMSDTLKAISEAMRRAAQKVVSEARAQNRPIPIWKDGRVVHEVPKAEGT